MLALLARHYRHQGSFGCNGAKCKAGRSQFPLRSTAVFLKPCSKPVYFDFLRTHFPHLEQMYEECYTPEGFVKEAYRERIAALVRALSQKYELGRRPREEAKAPPASAQRSFMWDTRRNPPPGSLCG